MNFNKAIKVTGFIHHNQPYGTDYIDGIWVPYTQEDLNQAVIDNTSADNEFLLSWQQPMNNYSMIKAKLKPQGGELIGKIIKGSTTNRLFQHTAVTDNAGQSVHMFVSKYDLDKNTKTSVAM